LFGDGSRPVGGPGGFGGGGGPGGGAGNSRSVQSDDQGLYVISGVGPQDMVLMAESDAGGGSRTSLVPGSRQSATADLQLLAFSSLSGHVTQNGQGLDGINVSAASQSVPNGTFNVQTGQDGSFRFDRLAPDTYRVSALAGRNPLRGITFHSQV